VIVKLRSAAAAIRRGHIIAFPTESFYALGVDATNDDAIRALFSAKLRMRNKPVALIAGNSKQVMKYLRLNRHELILAKKHWPGPFTMIVQPRKKRTGIQTKALGAVAIGVRVPAHAGARRLALAAGVPITATSANISGQPPTKSPRTVARVFPDILILTGRCGKQRKPSTVVQIKGKYLTLIRQGAARV